MENGEPLAKTPNFSWGIVKFSLRVVGDDCSVWSSPLPRRHSRREWRRGRGAKTRRRGSAVMYVGRNERSPN